MSQISTNFAKILLYKARYYQIAKDSEEAQKLKKYINDLIHESTIEV